MSELSTQALSIGYGATPLASGIALRLAQGTVACLLGPNGVGKTTLFRTLLGLLPPLAGKVLLGGIDLADLSRTAIARQIAYVPQAHAGPFAHAALDLVLMGRTAHLGALQRPGKADDEIARAALDMLGIGHLADHGIDRLSGGQRQLVFIARALAQQASIIVMDEPASSLDIANRLLLRRTIRRLAESGLAILLSTHEPDEAFAVGDLAALLRDGRLEVGPVKDMLTSATLSALYGTKLIVETTSSGRWVVTPADHDATMQGMREI